MKLPRNITGQYFNAEEHAKRLAEAASKLIAYIDRNWPGKRSERLPVQELREALAQWEAAQ